MTGTPDNRLSDGAGHVADGRRPRQFAGGTLTIRAVGITCLVALISVVITAAVALPLLLLLLFKAPPVATVPEDVDLSLNAIRIIVACR